MRVINTSTDMGVIGRDPALSLYVYNGIDCAVTHEIDSVLQSMFDATTRRTYQFSLALRAPILDMAMTGIKVDLGALRQAQLDIAKEMSQLKRGLSYLLTEGFGLPPNYNWNSTQQLQRFFYDHLGLTPVRSRSATGGYTRTTNRHALETLAAKYITVRPICNYILALKRLEKSRQFLNTPLDSDGRLRCSWNIAGTNTGRLASTQSDFATGTNSQNIDRALRQIFVPSPGMKLGNFDLEQADARNVGAICWNLGLPSLDTCGDYLDACEAADLHTEVSKILWPDLPWTGDASADKTLCNDKANPFYHTHTHRDCAKRIGHGVNYLGVKSVAQATGIPLTTLEQFRDRYYDAYPCIQWWHRRVRTQLQATHQITTLMGRRRTFYGRPNDDTTLREAVAYEPQSITADVVNTGLLRVWREVGTRARVLAQVHDSILVEYPEDEEERIVPAILELMAVPIQLKRGRAFTIPVEAKVGYNWADASKTNPRGLVQWM